MLRSNMSVFPIRYVPSWDTYANTYCIRKSYCRPWNGVIALSTEGLQHLLPSLSLFPFFIFPFFSSFCPSFFSFTLLSFFFYLCQKQWGSRQLRNKPFNLPANVDLAFLQIPYNISALSLGMCMFAFFKTSIKTTCDDFSFLRLLFEALYERGTITLQLIPERISKTRKEKTINSQRSVRIQELRCELKIFRRDKVK